jgi:hypothetical protein
MRFTSEESGQIGPFEELYALIVVIILIFVFTSVVAHSFWIYENRREPVERFTAGIDFSWLLKNNVLAMEVNGVPNPGLLADSMLLERGNYIYLNKFWDKPYKWEVIIRGQDGTVLYEFGSLNKDMLDPTTPKTKIDGTMKSLEAEVTIVYSPIALRHSDGSTEFARMEIWVW